MEQQQGIFIAFEGIDNSGKTTSSQKLYHDLTNSGKKVELLFFPSPLSPTFSIIRNFLDGEIHLDPHSAHMLFTANRWDCQKRIKELLKKGFIVIVDRWSDSGIAYSYASGLDTKWCKRMETDLIQPDVTFYMYLSIEEAKDREFDNSKYENMESLTKVKHFFDENIIRYSLIKADSPIEVISNVIRKFLKNKYNIHY
jgi:dTMP kinase